MVIISFLIVLISYLILVKENIKNNGYGKWFCLIPSLSMLGFIGYLIIYKSLYHFEVYLGLFASLYFLSAQIIDLFGKKYKIEIPYSVINLLPYIVLEGPYKGLVFFLVPLFGMKKNATKFDVFIVGIAAFFLIADIVMVSESVKLLAFIVLIGVSGEILSPINAMFWSFVCYASLPENTILPFWVIFIVLLILVLKNLLASCKTSNWYIVQLLLICFLNVSTHVTIPFNQAVISRALLFPLIITIILHHLYALKIIDMRMFKGFAALTLLSSFFELGTWTYMIYLKEINLIKIWLFFVILLPILSIVIWKRESHA